MYKELEAFPPPHEEAILWRYMTLEQFIDMLARESLVFTKASQFRDDVHEGFIPEEMEGVFRGLVQESFPDDFTIERINEIVNEIEKYRRNVMCNCWHQNKEESMAMWEKYRYRDSGIAIKTTMRNLKRSLSNSRDVYIGKIRYLPLADYNECYRRNLEEIELRADQKCIYFPFFHKRKAFEYEHEVRIVIDNELHWGENGMIWRGRLGAIPDRPPMGLPEIQSNIGVHVYVDIGTLIDEVIISPYTENWIPILIKDIVCKYGFEFDVRHSPYVTR